MSWLVMVLKAALGLACVLILAGDAEAVGPVRQAFQEARAERAERVAERRAARQCQPAAARVPAATGLTAAASPARACGPLGCPAATPKK